MELLQGLMSIGLAIFLIAGFLACLGGDKKDYQKKDFKEPETFADCYRPDGVVSLTALHRWEAKDGFDVKAAQQRQREYLKDLLEK